MSYPPPNVMYIVATDGYYWSRRDWMGSDIAFVTLVGVLLLVTFSCLFADCYYTSPQRHPRIQHDSYHGGVEEGAAWRDRRGMPRSDFL